MSVNLHVDACGGVHRNGERRGGGLAASLVAALRRSPVMTSAVLAGRALRDRAFDRALNIRTTPPNERIEPATINADPVYYEPTDYLLLRRYMKPLRLGADDVVFEVGCGLGRTLCMFARRRVRRCVGIEADPRLSRQALLNAQRLRGRRAHIDVRTIDALLADYDDGTIYWFNNPFGPATLELVLERIARSLRARPRPIQIAYVYPFHEHLMQSCGWLHCIHRITPLAYGTSRASYWVN